MSAGLCQVCPLSLILLVIFMDSVRSGNIGITSLFFADDDGHEWDCGYNDSKWVYSVGWVGLWAELEEPLLLHIRMSQLRCFGHLIRIPPGLPLDWLVGEPWVDPEPARGIIHLLRKNLNIKQMYNSMSKHPNSCTDKHNLTFRPFVVSVSFIFPTWPLCSPLKLSSDSGLKI